MASPEVEPDCSRLRMNTRSLQDLIPPVNVGKTESIVSVLAGASLILLGMGQRRLRGVLVPVGGLLVARGLSRRCPVNHAVGRSSLEEDEEPEFDSPVASVHRGEGLRVDQSIVINRSADELYRFWRNFENLP